MKSETPRPAAELIEHWTWTRRLAGHLVADSALADDVAQDAWLRASRHPDVPPSRGFLGTVVRNLVRERARGERHRADREHRAGAERTAPAPDEVLAAAETGQALAAAVLELPEVLRDVLLMRYFEGMTASQIAELLGVPQGTVRSRIKRGLDVLRERFDAPDGRSRLMALAGAPAAGAVAAATRSTWTVLRVAGVLAVAAAITAMVVLVGDGPRAGDASAELAVREVDDVAAPSEDLAAPASTEARNAVSTTAGVEVGAAHSTAIVVGRCVDEWHRPLEGVRVETSQSGSGASNSAVFTDEDGAFRAEFEVRDSVTSKIIFYPEPHRPQRILTFGSGGIGLARGLEAGVRDFGEVIFAPRGVVRARVVSPIGDPVADFQVMASTESRTYLGGAKTDDDGYAALERLRPGRILLTALDDWGRPVAETVVDVVPGRTVAAAVLVAVEVDGEMELMEHEESEEETIVDSERAPAVLRGRVTRSGEGVPDVVVLLRRLGGRDADWNQLAFMADGFAEDLEAAESLWVPHFTSRVRTDADGRFEFECHGRDVGYEIVASTDADHVRVLPVTVTGDETALGDLALVPYADLTLRVLPPEGLHGWEFECCPRIVDSRFRVASDANGLIHLRSMPAGPHTLFLSGIDDRLHDGAGVRVELQPGESRTVDVDARSFGMCKVTLHASLDGEPLPSGDVVFTPTGSKIPMQLRTVHRRKGVPAIVPWRGSERSLFVRALGRTDVGFVLDAGRSIVLPIDGVDLRSGAHVDVDLDMTRGATLDLTLPRELIPDPAGIVTIECAGGITFLVGDGGRIEAPGWGVETPAEARVLLRGLAPGRTDLRIRSTSTSKPDGEDRPRIQVPLVVEASVTLEAGQVSQVDLSAEAVVPAPR